MSVPFNPVSMAVPVLTSSAPLSVFVNQDLRAPSVRVVSDEKDVPFLQHFQL